MFAIGQNNGTGDNKAKFLRIFGGEVLTHYDTVRVLEHWFYSQTIPHGKSATFPVLGRVQAKHFNPHRGDTLTGQGSKTGEREIFIDDELLSDMLMPDIDKALSHFGYREPYVREMALAIARTMDNDLLALSIRAARTPGVTDEHDNGSKLVEATARTNGGALENAILTAASILDTKGVPQQDRIAILASLQYTNLLKSARSMEQDKDGAGNGSVAGGTINRIGGVGIVKDVNAFYGQVFGGNSNYDGSVNTKYAVDATNTAGVVVQKNAVGVLKLLEMNHRIDWIPEKRSDLLVSALVCGMDVLRPECAVEIAVS